MTTTKVHYQIELLTNNCWQPVEQLFTTLNSANKMLAQLIETNKNQDINLTVNEFRVMKYTQLTTVEEFKYIKL